MKKAMFFSYVVFECDSWFSFIFLFFQIQLYTFGAVSASKSAAHLEDYSAYRILQTSDPPHHSDSASPKQIAARSNFQLLRTSRTCRRFMLQMCSTFGFQNCSKCTLKMERSHQKRAQTQLKLARLEHFWPPNVLHIWNPFRRTESSETVTLFTTPLTVQGSKLNGNQNFTPVRATPACRRFMFQMCSTFGLQNFSTCALKMESNFRTKL